MTVIINFRKKMILSTRAYFQTRQKEMKAKLIPKSLKLLLLKSIKREQEKAKKRKRKKLMQTQMKMNSIIRNQKSLKTLKEETRNKKPLKSMMSKKVLIKKTTQNETQKMANNQPKMLKVRSSSTKTPPAPMKKKLNPPKRAPKNPQKTSASPWMRTCSRSKTMTTSPTTTWSTEISINLRRRSQARKQ